MKTDFELNELAVKLFGVDYIVTGDEIWITPEGSVNNYTERWNPLMNDYQAFRLSVKLLIDIEHWGDRVYAWREESGIGICEYSHQDPYLATRRAIVLLTSLIEVE